MDTVTLVISVYDALSLIRNAKLPSTIRDAAEAAVVNAVKSVAAPVKSASTHLQLVLKHVPMENKIKAIAAVRNILGLKLRDAKDWVEIVTGRSGYYLASGEWNPAIEGTPATIYDSRDRAEALATELRNIGCEVMLDDWWQDM